MKILFKNASILKMDDTPIFFGDLVVIDGLIKYIGRDSDSFGPFERVVECQGNLIMPGFKNCHSHNAMVFLRSKADDDTLHNWLFNVVFPREEKLLPSDIYHLTKVALLEEISSGITASLDMYFYPEEGIKAALEMGFRYNVQGCFNELTSFERLIDLYKKYNSVSPLVKYSIGCHAEYTSTLEGIDNTKKAIDLTHCNFHVHLAETKKEVDDCLNNRGVTPAKYFDQYDLFKNGGVCHHCVYLTDEDIALFKEKNIAVVTNPSSNLKLASGIAPIKKYLDSSLLIGIGTDGPASNNSLDMFKEMFLVATLAKVKENDPCAISAYDVLKMATVNGAKIMGFDDSDVLDVGKNADIIMIDMSKPSMQPINNVINNLVYAGSKDLIKLTMINGKILYEDGRFYIDENIDEIYEKAQQITDRIDLEARKDV